MSTLSDAAPHKDEEQKPKELVEDFPNFPEPTRLPPPPQQRPEDDQ